MKHATLIAIVTAALSAAACTASSTSRPDATTPGTPVADATPVAATPASAPAPAPTKHEPPPLSQRHELGICAASHFATIEGDEDTTAVLSFAYPALSNLDYEVSVYVESYRVSKLDASTAAYLEHLGENPPEWGQQEAGPTVIKHVEENLWHVIAAADIDAECPGASTPWDAPANP
jgi:hypothetical protein